MTIDQFLGELSTYKGDFYLEGTTSSKLGLIRSKLGSWCPILFLGHKLTKYPELKGLYNTHYIYVGEKIGLSKNDSCAIVSASDAFDDKIDHHLRSKIVEALGL